MAQLKGKTLNFKRNKKQIRFVVNTNMTDDQLIDAFESWFLRAKSITVDSFCDYINNKNAGFECNKV